MDVLYHRNTMIGVCDLHSYINICRGIFICIIYYMNILNKQGVYLFVELCDSFCAKNFPELHVNDIF